MGAVLSLDGRRKLTPAQLAEAVEMRRAGESYAVIGRAVGLSAPGAQWAVDQVLNPEKAAARALAHAKTMTRVRVGAPRNPDRAGRKSEKDLAANAAYMKQRREARRALIDKLKAVPCKDCNGEFHSAAMHFDHLPGTAKRFNIGERYAGASEIDLLDEIAKCEIVCANCHAVRTYNRRK